MPPKPEPLPVRRPARGLRVLVAPNPSPLTAEGTNTYILGEGAVAVIDPGPASAAHLEAILAALDAGERVSHILVTHSHLDHSPLARPLSRRTGAPVLAFGPSTAGRSARMERLAAEGGIGGGEGIDSDFVPDIALADGSVVEGSGWRIEAIHTPGHLGNHLCLAWGEDLFSGDHVMGWSTTLVSPPDGDMGAYMRALDRLAARAPRRLWPGHGAPVANGTARIRELIAHRRAREEAILGELGRGPATAAELAARLYRDTPPPLLGAATRNVLAHLLDLEERSLILPGPGPLAAAAFHRR